MMARLLAALALVALAACTSPTGPPPVASSAPSSTASPSATATPTLAPATATATPGGTVLPGCDNGSFTLSYSDAAGQVTRVSVTHYDREGNVIDGDSMSSSTYLGPDGPEREGPDEPDVRPDQIIEPPEGPRD